MLEGVADLKNKTVAYCQAVKLREKIQEYADFLKNASDAFNGKAESIRDSYSMAFYERETPNDKGQIMVCLSISPFRISNVPVVYLNCIAVHTHHRNKGVGTWALYCIKEFLRSYTDKTEPHARFYSNITGMYIIAGASKISKPDEFFEKQGFHMDELPLDFLTWRGDSSEETPCYLPVVQNSFESYIVNSGIRNYTIQYLLCKWWKMQPSNAKLFMKKQRFENSYSRLTAQQKKEVDAMQSVEATPNFFESTVQKDAEDFARLYYGSEKKRDTKKADKEEKKTKQSAKEIITSAEPIMQRNVDVVSCNTSFLSANGSKFKHCLVPKCNRLRVAGNNWTRHRRKHTDTEESKFQNAKLLFQSCVMGCTLCQEFTPQKPQSGKRLKNIAALSELIQTSQIEGFQTDYDGDADMMGDSINGSVMESENHFIKESKRKNLAAESINITNTLVNESINVIKSINVIESINISESVNMSESINVNESIGRVESINVNESIGRVESINLNESNKVKESVQESVTKRQKNTKELIKIQAPVSTTISSIQCSIQAKLSQHSIVVDSFAQGKQITVDFEQQTRQISQKEQMVQTDSVQILTTPSVQSLQIQQIDTSTTSFNTSLTQYNRDTTQADINVIKELLDIEQDPTSVMIQSLMLLENCHLWTQHAVSNYIERETHLKLNACIQYLLEMLDSVSLQQATGIIVAAYAAKGLCWSSAVVMLQKMDEQDQDDILKHTSFFVFQLTSKEIAQWVYEFWQFVTDKTHTLIDHLCQKRKEVNHRDILVLSLVVTYEPDEMDKFISFCHSLQRGIGQVLDRVIVAIQDRPNQSKISFDEFQKVFEMLCKSQNSAALQQIGDQLYKRDIQKWIGLVDSHKQSVNIKDADSVQQFLNDLIKAYGKIQYLASDLKAQDKLLQVALNSISAQPNNKQFALAQYIVGNAQKNQRQLWIVPSGQGKSRIAATVALISLLTQSFDKVHMVFNNEHLMQRDHAAFVQMWQIASLTQNIEYHTDIDFDLRPNEIVIIDEADVFIFDNPCKIGKFTESNVCVCFTATTAKDFTEKQVQDQMGFVEYKYDIQGEAIGDDVVEAMNESDLKFTQIVEKISNEQKVIFIKEQLSSGPVLLYCKHDLTVLLKELNPIIVDANIDPTVLQALHLKNNEEQFKLIISESGFGMRGIDYRSESISLTLIIANSFNNMREAIQGFNRVGRFNDPCTRVKFSDIPIIDSIKQVEQQTIMFAYIKELLKLKFAYQPVAVKKPTINVGFKSKLGTKRVEKLLTKTQLEFSHKK